MMHTMENVDTRCTPIFVASSYRIMWIDKFESISCVMRVS